MNAHITKNNNISAGTVARTAVLGLALANQILQRGAGGGQLSGAAEEGRALSSAGASIL